MKVVLEGGSMRPLLKPGKEADITPIPLGGISAGDVILYRAGDRRLLHRVGWISGNSLRMFDDAAVVGWHSIRDSDVLGRLNYAGPLSRGLPGLLYGLLVFSVFSLLRPCKTALAHGTRAR